MRPRPGFFPLRNRLISALSAAVLVVEARERSGSLVTASHAAHQGVEVWAVPGPLGAPASMGTNRLLFDGAHPALSPEHILESLVWAGLLPLRTRAGSAVPARGSAHSALVEALLHRPMTRDELARSLALAPERLALQLLELELSGSVAEDRDGKLRVVSPEKLPGLC
jgi:DNA processing protein